MIKPINTSPLFQTRETEIKCENCEWHVTAFWKDIVINTDEFINETDFIDIRCKKCDAPLNGYTLQNIKNSQAIRGVGRKSE